MMNKKGFTLVELMVVIVIIGVLAAVALPKFADAINKARCAEIPQKLKQTYNALVVYEGEHGTYQVDPGAGAAQATLEASGVADALGVTLSSSFFTYTGTLAAASFTATGATKDKMGDLTSGASLTMDHNGGINYSSTDATAWKKYVPAFVANASAASN